MLGYCRGGAIAIRVVSEQTPGVKCGMFCHPGPIDTKQWNTINVPTKWHLAKEDDYMKLEQIAALEQLGKKKAKDGVDMTYEIHEGESRAVRSRLRRWPRARGDADGRYHPWLRVAAERGLPFERASFRGGEGGRGSFLRPTLGGPVDVGLAGLYSMYVSMTS